MSSSWKESALNNMAMIGEMTSINMFKREQLGSCSIEVQI